MILDRTTSRKALPRGVSHTEFDTEEIIDSVDCKYGTAFPEYSI